MQDGLCQLYVMDTRSHELEKREITSLNTCILGDRGEEGDVEESGISDNEQHDMPPTPDTIPITTSTAMQETCDEIDATADTMEIDSIETSNNNFRTSDFVKCRGMMEEAASFNT